MKFKSDNTGTALYFPNFVPDDGWLKCSLLYWDRVRRIVPKSAEDSVLHTDPVYTRQARDADLLISTDCTKHLNETASLFDSQIKPLLDRSESEIRRWLASEGKKVRLHEGKFGEIQRSWLHHDSFLQPVTNDFVERGLFKRKGDFFQMPKLVGDLYITCLANVMSHPLGTPLLTDDPNLSVGSEQLVYADSSFSSDNGIRATAMQRIGIRFPHPDHLKNVPWRKFVKFQERYRQDRSHFRSAIETFVTEILKAKSPEMRVDLFDRKKKDVSELMKDHKQRLRTIGIKGMVSFLAVTVPSQIGIAAYAAPDFVSVPWLKAAGISLALANAWAKTSDEYVAANSTNPWHYTTRIQRRFN